MRKPTFATTRGLSATMVAVALLVSACGDDDDSNDAGDETTEPADDAGSDETTAPDETEDTAADDATEDTAADDATGDALLPDHDSLSFGALWETPPIIGVDTEDTTVPVGAAPDLAAALAPILGVEVEWQNMQWPAQLPGVQSGVVDALFGQVSVTEERELSIVDLIPFTKTTFSLLLPEGNPDEVTQLADACGLTIGVPVGSVQTELVERISAESCEPNGEDAIEPAEYQGATAAISAIQAGTIDGWLDGTTSINEAAASGVAAFATAELPDSEWPPQYTGIAVGKDQPEVSLALVEGLQILIEDGSYGEIMEAWGMEAAAVTADEVVINPITGTPAGEVAAE
ncbi:MAG: transporter substrate-binding domain-containing protein [Ilumatobacter sp.]|nr:transporter substrate-binding domain-containing protein [Ilumatobacter sp.]